MFRIRVSIAVTQKVCGNNGYGCKRNHEQWTCNPPKLSHAPRKRQNSCPNHSCYYMCYCRPLGPFTKYFYISPNNQFKKYIHTLMLWKDINIISGFGLGVYKKKYRNSPDLILSFSGMKSKLQYQHHDLFGQFGLTHSLSISRKCQLPISPTKHSSSSQE